MAAASEYALEPICTGAEFTLYRARQHGNPSPVLVVATAAEQPLPQSLRRLEHEYALAAELDPAWAAKPLALTRHEGRTILVLADPGGELVDGLGPNRKLIVIGATFDPIEVTPLQLISGSRTIQGWGAGTPADSEDTLRFAELSGVRPVIETSFLFALIYRVIPEVRANWRDVAIGSVIRAPRAGY